MIIIEFFESMRLLQKLDKSIESMVKPKKVNEFRVIVDTRYPNSQIISVMSPIPILEVILQYLSRATILAGLHAYKGFWQFPLHVDSQEIYFLLSDLESSLPQGSYKEQLTPQMLSMQGCWKHWQISSIVAC